MNAVEKYTAEVPNWATQIEYVVHEPQDEIVLLGEFPLERQPPSPAPSFLVAVASTVKGQFPPYLDVEILLTGPSRTPHQAPIDQPSEFVSTGSRLIIINRPPVGVWEVSAVGGRVPYAITVMAFHPAVPPNSPPSPGPTRDSPFWCGPCKTLSKALAKAILAGGTFAVLPHALPVAVAAYLGVPVAVALPFIDSVMGDSVDAITEKLCKWVNLC